MKRYTIPIALLLAGILFGVGVAYLALGLSALPDKQADTAHASAAPVSANDWCAEHRVPESQCTLCNPGLIEGFKERGDWCGEHDIPESHCRLCNPGLTFANEPIEMVTAEPVAVSVYFPPNETACASDKATIRFANALTAERIGLKVEPVLAAATLEAVAAPAEVVFDDTRSAALTTPIPATVVRWFAEPGRLVSTGQPLVELESPEMAELQSDFLQARAELTVAERHRQRAEDLDKQGMIPKSELDEAIAEFTAAQSRVDGLGGSLRSAGLDRDDLKKLTEERAASARWTIRAQSGNSLLERRARPGEMLQAGSTLGLIGDPNALWIEAHIREQDLSAFRTRQRVRFTADGAALSQAEGEVIWVSQYLEPDSRTGIVRSKVLSGTDQIRANLFGRIELIDSDPGGTLLVSREAVQWEGCCHLVFVQEATDRYRPRKVTIGRGTNTHYAVTSGVQEGDLVVTAGSFLLKTELKKESLGAGCTDH